MAGKRDSLVVPTGPRDKAQVRFNHDQIYEAPVGTPLEVFIKAVGLHEPTPVVAALVNDRLRELTYAVNSDVSVTPISIETGDGMRIYQRSLSFVLVVAVRELFPDTRVTIDHSLTMNGFYCEIQGRPPLTAEEATALGQRMREIVEEDAHISKQRVPLAEAIEIFRQQGYEDKVRLLAYRKKDYLTVYMLHGIWDYFYGYMVPSTGYLRTFDLRYYPPGFVLRFPRRSNPTVLHPFIDSPKLSTVFKEYSEWMRVMGVEDVGGLNQAIEDDRIREVILVAEALHERRIAQITEEIARRPQLRLVLVAGPSSSGKTTFLKRLSVQLLSSGLRPVIIGLDDYFVDREKTPLDESGNYDFEALGALDLELFRGHILELTNGREVTLPRYNFVSGKRETGPTIALEEEHIILIEGIHGLNPALVSNLPPEQVYRIYVSALTQLSIDHHNRIPTTDTRLLRRIVRDAATRGYAARDTIDRWESVRRGETRNIFPYQENADVMFNSALVYELAVLKPFAEPLLRQIEPGSLEYIEAKRLLAFLQWFLPCSPDLVPDNSILREFIGGSILQDLMLDTSVLREFSDEMFCTSLYY
jgi:uridine kinase